MLSELDRSTLRQSRFFDGVGLDAIEGLLDYCPVLELQDDELLLSPHVDNDCLYLVLEGRLEVHLADIESPGHLELGPGEIVGELSVVAKQRPSAYVIAAGACRLLMLPADALWSLVDHTHGVARNLLHILAGRMPYGDRGIVASLDQHRRFDHVASVDGMTGLHNRHWLEHAFARCLQRCARNGEAASVLIIDIDQFRLYNDAHGRLAADQALCEVARVLGEKLRPTDLLARYGGEEFAVLLPDARLEDALHAAERVRAAVEQADLGNLDGTALPRVTVSIGAAQMQVGETTDALLAQAEVALYRAKRNGRNRVEAVRERDTLLTA